MVVLGTSRFIQAKVVLFGQSGGIPGRLLYSNNSSCIFARWFYSGKVALFGQIDCIRAKMVVFGQKLYSCKMVLLG